MLKAWHGIADKRPSFERSTFEYVYWCSKLTENGAKSVQLIANPGVALNFWHCLKICEKLMMEGNRERILLLRIGCQGVKHCDL